MSGGQQQRVALARALAKRPAVLLLDEPLGALDLKLRKQMQTELARIHRQVGTTFVFVTHDQEEALSMATTHRHHVGRERPPAGLAARGLRPPADRFVADFVGDTNFLEGTVRRDGGPAVFDVGGAIVDVQARCRAGTRDADDPARVPGRATRDASDGTPGLAGRIVNVAFLGDHTRLTVATASGDDGRASGRMGPAMPTTDTQRELGEEVCVWWRAENAALIRE